MRKEREVVITGISAQCALGNNLDEIIENIKAGKTGIKKGERFKEFNLEKYPLGFIEDISYDFSQDKINEWAHIKSKTVIKEALAKARLTIEDDDGYKIGLAVGSSTLKVLKMQEYERRRAAGEENIPFMLMGDPYLANLANEFNIKGEVYNISTACSSSAGAICAAYDSILLADSNTMVVVSCDPLVLLSLAGFSSMQNLSEQVCMPFDECRKGINLGEAAVAIVLEEKQQALKRGANIYASICGYGQVNDGYSLTAPDPSGQGAYRAMKSALDENGVSIDQVAYINAHGTATKLNDSMEIEAIKQLGFEGKVSSTKSYTGHCLATAAAIELAISIASFSKNIPLINHRLDCPIDKELLLTEDNPGVDFTKPYILSNSFAFAGNSASLLVKVGSR